MFNKILVAIDRSQVSCHAFQAAIAMAKTMNAQLMLVHVLSPLDASYLNPVYAVRGVYPMFPADEVECHMQQWQTVQETSLEFLKAQTATATRSGVAAEYTQALGEPGQVICSLARNWGANLVILGRHGYKGLSELFLGSVSNYVMHYAPCSVLTVQGKPSTATASSTSQEMMAQS
jgi:nucleotide-binding universal stress UspA family protein